MDRGVDKERTYQKKFLEYVRQIDPDSLHGSYLGGSTFFEEVPLYYDVMKMISQKDVFMPDYRADLVEVDSNLNFHLWEAKIIHADDLIRGKVIGQLIFYDFLVSTYGRQKIVEILLKKGLISEVADAILEKEQKMSFDTWNVLVCGGEGWEIAAGVNPIMYSYPAIGEQYIAKSQASLNIYHFYEIPTGYDLKHIFELSIFYPHNLHPFVYERYLQHEGRSQEDWEATLSEFITDELLEWNRGLMQQDAFLKVVGRNKAHEKLD